MSEFKVEKKCWKIGWKFEERFIDSIVAKMARGEITAGLLSFSQFLLLDSGSCFIAGITNVHWEFPPRLNTGLIVKRAQAHVERNTFRDLCRGAIELGQIIAVFCRWFIRELSLKISVAILFLFSRSWDR